MTCVASVTVDGTAVAISAFRSVIVLMLALIEVASVSLKFEKSLNSVVALPVGDPVGPPDGGVAGVQPGG